MLGYSCVRGPLRSEATGTLPGLPLFCYSTAKVLGHKSGEISDDDPIDPIMTRLKVPPIL